MWDKTLENTFRVDDGARMSLALLAQMSEQGYLEANSIICKLIKKVAGGRAFDTPSAFVHSSVRNARERLMTEPRGEGSTGK